MTRKADILVTSIVCAARRSAVAAALRVDAELQLWSRGASASKQARRADACPHNCAACTEPLSGANAECEIVRDGTLFAGTGIPLAMQHSQSEESLESGPFLGLY